MTAVWPVTLPAAPDSGGFQIIYPTNVIRSNMDAGPTKQRRRVAWAKQRMVAPFMLTAAQLVDFETFYRTTTLSGTLVFEWTDPMRAVLGEYRIVEDPIVEAQEYSLWYIVTLVLEHVRDLP